MKLNCISCLLLVICIGVMMLNIKVGKLWGRGIQYFLQGLVL